MNHDMQYVGVKVDDLIGFGSGSVGRVVKVSKAQCTVHPLRVRDGHVKMDESETYRFNAYGNEVTGTTLMAKLYKKLSYDDACAMALVEHEKMEVNRENEQRAQEQRRIDEERKASERNAVIDSIVEGDAYVCKWSGPMSVEDGLGKFKVDIGEMKFVLHESTGLFETFFVLIRLVEERSSSGLSRYSVRYAYLCSRAASRSSAKHLTVQPFPAVTQEGVRAVVERAVVREIVRL